MKQLVCIVLAVFSFCVFSHSANHYVLDGGSGDGSSWSSSLDALPASLTRGDTYYIGDGNYAGYTFDDAVSGSTLITIKKATASDHGTETGWSSAYGDGQAIFSGVLEFSSNYVVMDGVSGEYPSTPFGFVVYTTDANQGSSLEIIGFYASEVQLKYVEAYGVTNLSTWSYTSGVVVLYFGNCTNVTVSHCYAHGGDSLIYCGDGVTSDGFDSTGIIVEYTTFQAARAGAPAHNNLFYCTGTQNGVFRYNKAFNYDQEGFFLTGWEGPPKDWKIYGNLFYGTGDEDNARGVEFRPDYNYTNILVYNNTFAEIGIGSVADRTGETGNSTVGCEIVNNLAYNAPFTFGSSVNRSNVVVTATTNWVNYSTKDFRLASPSANSGYTLSSPYNVDMLGTTRGADGTWDIGAYEYTAGEEPPATTRKATLNGTATLNNFRSN